MTHGNTYTTSSRHYLSISSFLFVLLPLVCIAYIMYPVECDELASILIYASDWRMFFVKNSANNHIVTNILGFFLSNIFVYNIITFRIISIISSITIFAVIYKTMEKSRFYIGTIVSLTFLFCYESYFVYSVLFRGYILQALLVFLGTLFAYRYIISHNKKDILISNLIFATGFIHLPTTIYIWVPTVLTIICFRYSKNDLLTILRSFIWPVSLVFGISMISVMLTGYIVLKPDTPSISDFLETLKTQKFDLMISGFKTAFLNKHYIGQTSGLGEYMRYMIDKLFMPPYHILLILSFIVISPVALYKAGYFDKLHRNMIIIFVALCALTHIVICKTPESRVYLVYVPLIAFLSGVIIDRIVAFVGGRFRARPVAVYAGVFCICVIIAATRGYSYLNSEFSFPAMRYIPSVSFIKTIARNNCDSRTAIESYVFGQFVAFYSQQECSKRWPISEIRETIRTRPLRPDAGIYLMDRNTNPQAEELSILTGNKVVKIYQDEILVAFKAEKEKGRK